MRRTYWFVTVVIVGLVVAAVWVNRQKVTTHPASVSASPSVARSSPEPVVINEAARTLLYLPLYLAVERGYFRAAGLDVQIVTGGTATNCFAAMLSGEAQFCQADPMYVPISREKGGRTKVVAQVVGRIAVWAVTMDPAIPDMSPASIRGRTISTHQRPMTAYTYTTKLLKDEGLDPSTDVKLITGAPGTETIPLFNGEADVAVTIEPSASQAVSKGARVIYGFPDKIGDQVLTGLMTTEMLIGAKRPMVVRIVQAYQQSLNDIHRDPVSAALAIREKYFPQVASGVFDAAVKRLTDERVFPESVEISPDSWNRAVSVRVESGDLKAPVSLEEGCDVQVMKEGASQAAAGT